jgi:hypothetical protein
MLNLYKPQCAEAVPFPANVRKSTGRVVGLEVSILRVVGSYPTQWTSMYVLVNPNPYGTG